MDTIAKPIQIQFQTENKLSPNFTPSKHFHQHWGFEASILTKVQMIFVLLED